MACTSAAQLEDSCRWIQQSSISPNSGTGISGTARLVTLTPMHQHGVAAEAFPYSVEQRINPYPNGEDADYGTWEKALDVGHSYLVGAAVSMPELQRVYTSSLNEWQRLAFEWCMANPSRMLVLASTRPRLIYHIAKRGEYIEIGLPHHCHGGEKYWSAAMARPRF
jgi:hypothetical protein